MSEAWLTMTAADLGRGIGDGAIDPLDLAKTYLDAIAKHPLSDRIYARVTEDPRTGRSRGRIGPRSIRAPAFTLGWRADFLERPVRHCGDRHRGRIGTAAKVARLTETLLSFRMQPLPGWFASARPICRN